MSSTPVINKLENDEEHNVVDTTNHEDDDDGGVGIVIIANEGQGDRNTANENDDDDDQQQHNDNNVDDSNISYNDKPTPEQQILPTTDSGLLEERFPWIKNREHGEGPGGQPQTEHDHDTTTKSSHTYADNEPVLQQNVITDLQPQPQTREASSESRAISALALYQAMARGQEGDDDNEEDAIAAGTTNESPTRLVPPQLPVAPPYYQNPVYSGAPVSMMHPWSAWTSPYGPTMGAMAMYPTTYHPWGYPTPTPWGYPMPPPPTPTATTTGYPFMGGGAPYYPVPPASTAVPQHPQPGGVAPRGGTTSTTGSSATDPANDANHDWWVKYYQHYYQLTSTRVMPGLQPPPPPNPWTLQVPPGLMSHHGQPAGGDQGSAATTPTPTSAIPWSTPAPTRRSTMISPNRKKQKVDDGVAHTSQPNTPSTNTAMPSVITTAEEGDEHESAPKNANQVQDEEANANV